MSEKQKETPTVNVNNGVGLIPGLVLLLAAGKIFGFLPTWSWVWVFCPIWLPALFVLSVGILYFTFLFILDLVSSRR